MTTTTKNEIINLLEEYRSLHFRLQELEHPTKPEHIDERRYLEKKEKSLFNNIKYLIYTH